MDPKVIEEITLLVMEGAAKDRGLAGVAFAHVRAPSQSGPIRPTFLVVERFTRPPDPKRDTAGAKDTGTNYGAVAASKFWEMLDTQENSGVIKPAKKGTFGFPGGLIQPTTAGEFTIYVGFSGGTSSEDVEVAELGKTIARGLIENPAAFKSLMSWYTKCSRAKV